MNLVSVGSLTNQRLQKMTIRSGNFVFNSWLHKQTQTGFPMFIDTQTKKPSSYGIKNNDNRQLGFWRVNDMEVAIELIPTISL